jgi:DNA-binding MarR family transcriptional regulator
MSSRSDWTFLTNHALVLLCIASTPRSSLREIGDRVGVTERAAHRIVADLAAAGYVVVRKDGRRNLYEVQTGEMLRHDEASHVPVGDLLEVLLRRR